MTADARSQAFFMLNKLNQRKYTLDYYLEELDRKALLTDKRERALLNALVYGVLRQQAWLDYVLRQFSSKPMNALDYEVRNILRLALFQIMFMDKIPVSAAVNTAVEITKKYKPKAAGFVNAVLRKSAAQYQNINPPNAQQNKTEYLSITHALPQWLATRWLKRFGPQGLAAICDGLNDIPPLTLRINTLKTTAVDLAEKLRPWAENIEAGAYSAWALNLAKPCLPVYELPGYAEGLFLVQDEAAQLSAALVDPQPGETILDACAGVGGKTLSMAIAAHNQAQITSTDLSPAKLERITAESRRLGLNAPKTAVVNWLMPLPEITAKLGKGPAAVPLFHKVLVDAPCSGLGVLRRNPDTKWTRTLNDLPKLAEQQLAILQNAAAFVKPNGRLIYTVCSTEPEETEAVIETFLNRNPVFSLDTQNINLPLNFKDHFNANQGYFCTYPFFTNMDGFFMARFVRQN